MNGGHEAGNPGPGLTQFQLKGDAAEHYERWAVPFVIGPSAPGLLDLAALRAGQRVLDVATGTGIVARLAVRRVAPGGTVTGVDLNEGMLKAARRFPLPPGRTIDWHQGSALALPFSDRVFDVVLCQQGLQFFPDRPYFVAQREGLARHVSSEAATSIAAAFSLGSGDELRSLLEAAGFHDVVVHHVRMTLRLPPPEDFLLGHLSALPVAELVAAAGEDARVALVIHMKEAMRAYVDGDGLAVPQEVNVATARV